MPILLDSSADQSFRRSADELVYGISQTLAFGRRWPRSREEVIEELTRRWEAYLGLAYRRGDIERMNLFVAVDSQDREITVTRRMTRDLQFVCEVDAASIASNSLALQVRPDLISPDDDAGLALERGAEVWRRSGVDRQRQRWALNLCVFGEGYLEALNTKEGAVVVWHDPRTVEVQLDPTGRYIERAVITIYHASGLEIDPETGAYTGERKTVQYRRVITPAAVQVFRDGQPVAAESGRNPLGAVPLVRVAYRDVGDGSLSTWAGYGYEDALAAVDSFFTQLQALTTRHANPILKAIGVQVAQDARLSEAGRSVALPIGADLQWLEATLQGANTALDAASRMREALVQTLPEFLFVDSGASASGTALSYRAGAFVAKIEPIRRGFYRALAEVVGMAVAIDYGAQWDDLADVYVVDGGSALPMDVTATSELTVSLLTQGLLTASDAVRVLQGLGVGVPEDADSADYAARAQAEMAARTGGTLDSAREVLAKLEALQAMAYHEQAEAPMVEAEEEQAEAAGLPEADADAGEMEDEGEACPIATQDIATNLRNRQRAIDAANYGPANPDDPGDYWAGKARRMRASEDEVRTMVCGNCAFFDIRKRTIDCIEQGIGEAAAEVVAAGKLGFCEAFDFKCASARTCDAWVVGGPVTDAGT